MFEQMQQRFQEYKTVKESYWLFFPLNLTFSFSPVLVSAPEEAGLRVRGGAVRGQGGALHDADQLPGAHGERPRVPHPHPLHRPRRGEGHRPHGRRVRRQRSRKLNFTPFFSFSPKFPEFYLVQMIEVGLGTAYNVC